MPKPKLVPIKPPSEQTPPKSMPKPLKGWEIRAAEIAAQFAQMRREPFKHLLAEVLENAPTPEAIRALAKRDPSRYGQLLAIVARLAGYTDRLQVDANVTTHIKDLSDAELLQRLAKLTEKPSA